MKKVVPDDSEKYSDQSDLIYLEKRYKLLQSEKDLISKENTSLKEELKNFKEYFYKMIDKVQSPQKQKTEKPISNQQLSNLMEVLQFQRDRIQFLEQENSKLQQKYEKYLFDSQNSKSQGQIPQSLQLYATYHETSDEIIKAYHKIEELEKEKQQIIQTYGQKIQSLQSKLAQTDASLLVASSTLTEFFKSDKVNQSVNLGYTQKNNSKKLEPIIHRQASSQQINTKNQQSSQKIFSNDKDTLFSYKK